MSNIPARFECAYCTRYKLHGGECFGKESNKDSGCLFFRMDNRGCIRNRDLKLSVPIYHEIPKVGVWNDDWKLNEVDTEIKINKINALDWDPRRGNIIIFCNIDYFINEFHEDYKENQKSNLKIIK